jgi:hypothetical protein
MILSAIAPTRLHQPREQRHARTVCIYLSREPSASSPTSFPILKVPFDCLVPAGSTALIQTRVPCFSRCHKLSASCWH